MTKIIDYLWDLSFLLDWFEVERLSVMVNYTTLSIIKLSVKVLCECGSFSIDVCLFMINMFIAPTEAIQQRFKLIQLFLRTESLCNKN